MFAATISITINSVAKVLQRIKDNEGSSSYRLRETDGEYNLTIRQSSYLKKGAVMNTERHAVELVHTLYPVAPATVPIIRKQYMVLENEVRDTTAAVQKFSSGFAAFLTDAVALQLINGEN